MKVGEFFSNISRDVARNSKQKVDSNSRIPVLFRRKTLRYASFYSFMNYADFDWNLAPKTGMFDVVRAMESLAKELGVKFQTNIEKIIVENKTAVAIQANGERIDSDLVLSGADYHHTETLLTGAQSVYREILG
jgi:phytoene desaturase